MSTKTRIRESPSDSVAVAYEAIRALIVEGRLGPGSRLIERDLAEFLEISRSPVRSALLRLQQERYVLSRRGKRARLIVAPLTRADARELYEIVGFLDGVAARRAASLARHARQLVVTDMKQTARELERVADQLPFDARRFFDLDSTFHNRYIDEVLNTPRMMSLYGTLRPQTDRYRLFYSSGDHVGSLAQVAAEHKTIVAAIEAGDPDAASQAAERNWECAAQRVCAIINMAGERGDL